MFAQLEPGLTPTGYIFTDAAPVTLTDYTLAGTTVNLAQVPATGALLDWSGLYIP